MDVEHLRSFREVCRRGSVSRASLGLSLTASAISRHVGALESELGQRLFERQSNRMLLTADGERLLDYCERILGLIDEAVLVMSGRPTGGRQMIHVGCSPSVGNYLIPQYVAAFATRHPGIEVVHRNYERPTVETLVANGTLDLGVIPGPTRHPDVHSRWIADDELILVAGPSHPLVEIGSLLAEGLEDQPLFVEELRSAYRESVIAHLSRIGVPTPRFTLTPSIEASKRMVMAGFGLAYLPVEAVSAELELGLLVELRLSQARLRRQVVVIAREAFPVSGPLSELVAHLRHCFEKTSTPR